MTQGSARFIPSIHLHEDEPDIPAMSPLPSSPDADSDPADGQKQNLVGRLRRDGDQVLYEADQTATPARIAWALPLSARPGPVSIMVAGKKKELAYLDSLDRLDPDSRTIAEEELGIAVILPRITAIHSIWPRFGNYYWDVDTDKGRRKFLVVSPENNSQYVDRDTVVIKDVAGNTLEISPISGLDKKSLKELDKIL